MNIGSKSQVLLRLGVGGRNVLKWNHNGWAHSLINKEVSNRLQNLISVQQRTYLSESFECNEAWQERLKVPPIASLELNKYYFELERKFTRDGLYLPIDVDIFANALLKPDSTKAALKAERIGDRLEQMQEILQRFRQTPQTNFMLPSTSHAVVRAFLEGNGTDKLLNILNERQAFGLFPDEYSFVQMLNHFLKNDSDTNLRDASKVAITMMLQEEYDIPIACEMGMYGAYEYTNTESFKSMNEDESNWNPIKPEAPPEPEDEVKVRVWFADNDYFDDHFDLTKREHLVGKTLAKFAQCTKRPFLRSSENKNTDIVRNSLELLGWSLFEKWDKASHLLSKIENNSEIAQSCHDAIKQFAEKSNESSDKESYIALLEKMKTVDIDVSSYLRDQVKVAVSENEGDYINEQISIYREWIMQRDNEVKRKMEMWEKNERKQQLSQRQQELAREEERLFFFENYAKIEKEKQAKFREWQKTWPRKSGIKIDPNRRKVAKYIGEK